MAKVMVFKATINNISVILCDQFYWWMKPDCPQKTANLSQVAEQFIT
jgi:hypothetical protein